MQMAAHLVDAAFPEIAVEIVKHRMERQKVKLPVREAIGQCVESRLSGLVIVDGDIETAQIGRRIERREMIAGQRCGNR